MKRRDKRNGNRANARSDKARKPHPDRESAARARKPGRRPMEILFQLSIVIAVILAAIASLLGLLGHRDLALWSTYAIIVVASGGFFCWWQDHLWRKDALAQSPGPPATSSPNGPKVEGLVVPSTPSTEAKSASTATPSPAPTTPPADDDLLRPGDKPTPSNIPGSRPPGFPKVPTDAFFVLLGDSWWWSNGLPKSLFRQKDEDMLSVTAKDGGIALSGKFFSADGKAICELVENRLIPNEKNDSYWRTDREPSRLRVVGTDARVLVDIEFLNPRCIRLLGSFFLRDGFPLDIGPTAQRFGPIVHHGSELNGSGNVLRVD